jgi:hypothetical protein
LFRVTTLSIPQWVLLFFFGRIREYAVNVGFNLYTFFRRLATFNSIFSFYVTSKPILAFFKNLYFCDLILLDTRSSPALSLWSTYTTWLKSISSFYVSFYCKVCCMFNNI